MEAYDFDAVLCALKEELQMISRQYEQAVQRNENFYALKELRLKIKAVAKCIDDVEKERTDSA